MVKKHWLGSKVIFFTGNSILKKKNNEKYLLETDFSVPQCSTFGLLLFWIYINDLHHLGSTF